MTSRQAPPPSGSGRGSAVPAEEGVPALSLCRAVPGKTGKVRDVVLGTVLGTVGTADA